MHTLKLLVFSDSHGNTKPMELAIAAEKPDMVLHLGDYVRDYHEIARIFPNIPMKSIAGNCDYPLLGEDLLLELKGVRILMTHGHRYRVKQTLLSAAYAAREAQAELLLYGHTHVAAMIEEPGLVCMNPGAAGTGCYGVVTLQDGAIHCQLKNLR